MDSYFPLAYQQARILKTDKSKDGSRCFTFCRYLFQLYPDMKAPHLQSCSRIFSSRDELEFLDNAHPVHDSLEILANTYPLKHLPEVFTGFLFILSHWAFPCFTSSPLPGPVLTTLLPWVLGHRRVNILSMHLGSLLWFREVCRQKN